MCSRGTCHDYESSCHGSRSSCHGSRSSCHDSHSSCHYTIQVQPVQRASCVSPCYPQVQRYCPPPLQYCPPVQYCPQYSKNICKLPSSYPKY
ncbi:putative small proline-rich protein 5 [Nothoprocta perdicaria]|uniref:Putative small proline-rich protein 5 n=1 Tax=Nothoprocta perdicaria TaxID=30464 RepID=A0A8C7E7Q2_NOTPE|nr:putative small proline-rich protein 5 [Nothoprocta perdicaria]